MATLTSSTSADSEDQFPALLAAVRDRFASVTGGDNVHLFSTQLERGKLFNLFLDAFPPGLRQHYTCNACRSFINRFGGLAFIGADGTVESAMWSPHAVPDRFREVVAALARVVAQAPISNVYLSSDPVWGTPETGPWSHFSVTPAERLLFRASLPTALRTARQAAAVKWQDNGSLAFGLDEYPLEILRQAHALLTTDQLARSEKCIGVAKWLVELQERRQATKNLRVQRNLVWLAAAGAPVGWCHVKSGMIGTLLDDIAAGRPFGEVKARWDAKMHPLQYQRPTAAPSAGNIARAETIMSTLSTAGALERRFAKLSDINKLWTPAPPAAAPAHVGGVFAHLKPASPSSTVDIPPTTSLSLQKGESGQHHTFRVVSKGLRSLYVIDRWD